MNNRTMRILVLFDLPTATPAERRDYMQFRKFLIRDGYDMLQYSVYSRITANHDDANSFISYPLSSSAHRFYPRPFGHGKTICLDVYFIGKEDCHGKTPKR